MRCKDGWPLDLEESTVADKKNDVMVLDRGHSIMHYNFNIILYL